AVHRPARWREDHGCPAAGQVPGAEAGQRRAAGDPPAHERPAAARAAARGDAEAHPRGADVHAGRAAAVRRSPYLRRALRHRAGRTRSSARRSASAAPSTAPTARSDHHRLFGAESGKRRLSTARTGGGEGARWRVRAPLLSTAVFLKSLTLKGFKSFAETTTL